jgi:hypothetical protein
MTTENPAPEITKILKEAIEDLENTSFSGYLGKLFNPINEGVLIPGATKAPNIVPNVPPFIDEVGAFLLCGPVSAMKLGYTALPHKEFDEETNDIENGDMLALGTTGMQRFEEPKSLLSSLMGIVGFTASTLLDIATLPFKGKFVEWNRLTLKLLAYLIYTGVGIELGRASANPRSFKNLLIIANVQAKHNGIESVTSRRARAAMKTLPSSMSQATFKKVMQDAAHFCRYATAAYGVFMIDSADLLQVFDQDLISFQFVEGSS